MNQGRPGKTKTRAVPTRGDVRRGEPRPISKKGIVPDETVRLVREHLERTDRPYLPRPRNLKLTLGARHSNGLDAYEFTYRTTGNAFWLLERVAFPMQFTSREGELLGSINLWDGPSPGSDYQAVTATSDEVLSYLQLFLNQGDSGIHIRVRGV